MYRPKSIQVHAGTFHADDVICCAQAMILNDDVDIIRSDEENENDLENGVIVADVGGGRFDHHQKNVKLRKDGFKHCAASLLWEFWGHDIIRSVSSDLLKDEYIKNVWDKIDKRFMMTLSVTDNGLYNSDEKLDCAALGVSSTVSLFNPTWVESEADPEICNEYFFNCVKNIKEVFYRFVLNAIDSELAMQEVLKIMKDRKDKHILILDKYISWDAAACTDEELYCVVYPSMRGGWNVQLVPKAVGSYETVIDVPEWWKGYRFTGKQDRPMPGMTFCHATGFLSVYDSKEHAERSARYLADLADTNKQYVKE